MGADAKIDLEKVPHVTAQRLRSFGADYVSILRTSSPLSAAAHPSTSRSSRKLGAWRGAHKTSASISTDERSEKALRKAKRPETTKGRPPPQQDRFGDAYDGYILLWFR